MQRLSPYLTLRGCVKLSLTPLQFSSMAAPFISAAAATLGSVWLWQELPLYAVAASALLLFGGATFLPSRHMLTHSVSLGVCVGVALGGAWGIMGFLHGAA